MQSPYDHSAPAIPDDVAALVAKASAEARKNLDITLVHFPEQLKNLTIWTLWRYEVLQKKSGEWRTTKVPYVAQPGKPRHAASTRPKEWRPLKVAQAVLQQDWASETGGFYDGLMFMFNGSGYSGIDMDHVLTGSALLLWAEKVVETDLHAAYIERSISNTGLHGIVGGTFTGAGISEKFSDDSGFELYCSGRGFVVSGQPYNGSASVIAAANVQALCDRFKHGEIGPDDFRAQQKAKAEKRASVTKRIVDVNVFLDRHQIEVHRKNAEHNFTCYGVTCPGCQRQDAYVLQHSDGGVSMGCYSASCAYTNQKDHWYEFKKHHEAKTGRSGEKPHDKGANGGLGRPTLIPGKNERPLACLANVEAVLTHVEEWRDTLGFNEFSFEIVTLRATPYGTPAGKVWADTDDSATAVWMQRNGIIASSKTVGEAVQLVARKHPFHPLKQKIDGLTWDNKKRLDTWLPTYLGAKDTPYVRTVGNRWLISMMARLYAPGCKADHVLMLEGPQGKRKSTALSLLVGDEYFTDHLSELGSKDCMQEMAGVWLIELSEIENYLHGSRAQNSFKAFITSRTDYFREPYGRRPVRHPRHSIIAATTNSTRTLTDPTGTRRIWPVECGEIKIDELRENVDQLMAEARDCYRNGDPWYLETEELEALASEEQEKRYEPGQWDSVILDWIEDPKRREEAKDYAGNVPIPGDVEPWDGSEAGKVTIQDILIHGIGKPLERIEQKDRSTVARCLEHENWKVHQDRSRGARRGKRFYYAPQRFREQNW